VADLDPAAPRSVHHCDFPVADSSLIDATLEAEMAVVREVVALGHSLRKQSQVKVRQPLRRAAVLSHDPLVAAAVAAHADLIAGELNVKSVGVETDESDLVELSVKCDFKRLGKRLGPRMKEVAAAVNALAESDIKQLLEGGTVEVAGEVLGSEDVIVGRTPRPGTVVETAGALAVSLDTSIDHELAVEGAARELVSRVQTLRREAGLAMTDHITLAWNSPDATVAAAFTQHAAFIASEVLADQIVVDPSLELSTPANADADSDEGVTVGLAVSRAD
jgi:isoleucyl-tRNA synthetase